MKNLLIQATLKVFANKVNSKVKNERLKALLLFKIDALSDIANILTDSDKDDNAQLEKYATEKLPELIGVLEEFTQQSE